ncbi:glycoside hydrolase family 61 protein [Hygrophoropsis aurantiaca]|uniref:Glycoside hydrolase family 61 protein n=1 Tax=Hygrophoropsis aurantiaca TaxID=72124 RepID=A0ACB8A5G8_9AGAM|nr:glycoside hydrolase family 61 protein [Hygrophoropsis aurantiaca]
MRFQSLLPLSVLSLCLAVLPTVYAHGYVAQVTIDGKLYQGNVPNASPTPSIVRQINDVAPVKGASNANLNCGQSAQKASLVASANPGSKLTFKWEGGDGSNWPHNIGPLMTYMASCTGTTCDQYDSTNAEWFKISQVGLEPGDMVWYQQVLMNGGVANVTIPSTISPGQYLIRHEIIALHLANEMGGAEFYPSCTQVNVGGSQTGTAQASEMVTFPGGYSDSDPGIYDPTIFDTPVNYPDFPGPPVAAFVSGSSSGTSTSSGSPSSSPSASSPPASTSSAESSGGTGSCKLKARNLAIRNLDARRPRSVSRVMRKWLSDIAENEFASWSRQ